MLLRETIIAAVVLLLFFFAAISLVGSGVSTSILAGALTGLIEGIIMFPLENIKIQQQLDGNPMGTIIRRTWQRYGWVGFFKGLSPVLVGAVPTQAIRWGSFEVYCSYFSCSSLFHIAMGGIFSGILNSLVTGVPIETMKTSIIHSHFGGSNSNTSGSPTITNNTAVTSCSMNTQGGAPQGGGGASSEVVSSRFKLIPSTISTNNVFAVDMTIPRRNFISPTTNNYAVPSFESTGIARAEYDADLSMRIPDGHTILDVDSPQILPVDPSMLMQSRRFQSTSTADVVNRRGGSSSGDVCSRIPMTSSPTTAVMMATPSNTAVPLVAAPPGAPTKKAGLRGWIPTVLKKLINQAIRFPAHAFILRLLCTLVTGATAEQAMTVCRSGHPLINFIAGALAGLASIMLTQPIDVAKTRMQGLTGYKYRHTLHCLKTIFITEGLRGFTHGIASRSIRVALGSGLTFAIFPIFHTMFISMAADFSQVHQHSVVRGADVTLRPDLIAITTAAAAFLHHANATSETT